MAARMIPLSIIKDNPFRDKKRNPIDPEKVEQLAESIETTKEFWEGVYGRELPNGNVELAFGHHRLDAARAAGLKEIPITLRKLTDGDMLMRMTRENLRGELPVMLEAVAAAVRALGDGKIEVEEPSPKTNTSAIRYAPSFVPGRPCNTSEVSHPYTMDGLARFLGGMYTKKSRGQAQNSVVAALGILELEERAIPGFSPKVVEGKTIREAIAVVSDLRNRHVKVVERQDKTRAEIQATQVKQSELDRQRHEAEEKKKQDDLADRKRLADAKREEDEREAARVLKEMKDRDKRFKEREEANTEARKKLEATIKEREEWLAQQKLSDPDIATRQAVKNMLYRLETITSERNAFRETIKSLARDKKVTLKERDLLFQAMNDVGEWYHKWAGYFAKQAKVDVLKEARKKEEARHKRK